MFKKLLLITLLCTSLGAMAQTDTPLPSGVTAASAPSWSRYINGTDTSFYFYTGGKGINVVGRRWLANNYQKSIYTNIQDYGAVGDSITDNTAAIRAAVTAMVASGNRTLFIPKGKYLISDTINIPVQCTVIGENGMRPNQGGYSGAHVGGVSVIIQTLNNKTAFAVTHNGVNFRDLSIVCTSASSSTSGSGIAWYRGNSARMQNVHIQGFWINNNLLRGDGWVMIGNSFVDPGKYNMSIANADLDDEGDNAITNNLFLSAKNSGVTHIHYTSGGGLRMTANTFNWPLSPRVTNVVGCLDVEMTVNTSVLLIENNHMENFTQFGIRIKTTAGVSYAGLQIANNFISANNPTQARQIHIEAADYSTAPINYVTINGNQIPPNGTGIAGLYLKNINIASVYGNSNNAIDSIVNCTNVSFYTPGNIQSGGNLAVKTADLSMPFSVNPGNSHSSDGIGVINTVNANKSALWLSNWTGAATTYGPKLSFENSGNGLWHVGSSDGLNRFEISRTWGTPDFSINSSGYTTVNQLTATDGTQGLIIKPAVFASGYGAIYGTGTPTSSNHLFAGKQGFDTYVNGTTDTYLSVNNNNVLRAKPSGVDITGALVISGNVSATNLSGINTGDQTSVTGNAGTATALQTGRTIGALTGDVTSSGSSFNGTANNTNSTVVGRINGVALSGLATGLLKNTTTTGVPSIAVAGTDYQAPITLTTTGSSGASTFTSNTLNIPTYTLSGLGGITASSTDVLTNKSISGNTNTLTAIPNSALTNSTISGVSLGSNLNNITFNNGGSGDASGTTYNGSVAKTISYNSIGALPTSGFTTSAINTLYGYTPANGANYLPLSGGNLTGPLGFGSGTEPSYGARVVGGLGTSLVSSFRMEFKTGITPTQAVLIDENQVMSAPKLTSTTQSAGDNSTKVATTAYVDKKIISGTYTTTAAAQQIFTISIGSTQPSNTYKVFITGNNLPTYFSYGTKTTTTFEAIAGDPITGGVTLDWMIVY